MTDPLIVTVTQEVVGVSTSVDTIKVNMGVGGPQGLQGVNGTAQATASTFAGLPAPTAGEIRRVTDHIPGLYLANGTTWVGPTKLDAREFGEIGSTASTNKATIDAAFTRASSLNGAEVYLPVVGVVPTTSAPLVPANTHFRGLGNRATRLQVTSTTQWAVGFAAGSNQRISNLFLDAASVQSTGGGISFRTTGNRRTVDHIRFGDNLFKCLDMVPPAPCGHWTVEHINLDSVSGIGTVFELGDGTNLVTDIFMSKIICGAATNSGINRWFWIHNNVDTLKLSESDFVKCTTDSVIGDTAAGAVTEPQFTDVTLDSGAAGLLKVRKVRNFEHKGLILTSGGGLIGIDYEAGAQDVQGIGGKTQNCAEYGERIQAGSLVRLTGRRVMDNNTSNASFADGILVASNTTDFELMNIRTGNGDLPSPGNQKHGIQVSSGCDRFRVQNCTGDGNVTSSVLDNSGTPATWKEVNGNH